MRAARLWALSVVLAATLGPGTGVAGQGRLRPGARLFLCPDGEPGSVIVELNSLSAADGYAASVDSAGVRVDGRSVGSVRMGQSAEFGVCSGSHEIVLDVPGNCVVRAEADGRPSVNLAIEEDSSVRLPFGVGCQDPGSVVLRSSTTGAEFMAAPAFVVSVGRQSRSVPANGTVSFDAVPPQRHDVTLRLPTNCRASAPVPTSVVVQQDSTTNVSIVVACTRRTGSIAVRAVTRVFSSGAGRSLGDGYEVTVDDTLHARIVPTDTLTDSTVSFTDLALDEHTVTLTGLGERCSAPLGESQTVSVAQDSTPQVTFAVTCFHEATAPDTVVVTTLISSQRTLLPTGTTLAADTLVVRRAPAVLGERTITVPPDTIVLPDTIEAVVVPEADPWRPRLGLGVAFVQTLGGGGNASFFLPTSPPPYAGFLLSAAAARRDWYVTVQAGLRGMDATGPDPLDPSDPGPEYRERTQKLVSVGVSYFITDRWGASVGYVGAWEMVRGLDYYRRRVHGPSVGPRTRFFFFDDRYELIAGVDLVYTSLSEYDRTVARWKFGIAPSISFSRAF